MLASSVLSLGLSLTPNPTAVVVGAGPAGLATSWVLAERGFDVTLLERRPKPSMYESQKAYLYLVDGRGQQFTDAAGLTEQLASRERSVSSTNYTVTRLLPDGKQETVKPPILESDDDGRRPSYWIPRQQLCALFASKLEGGDTSSAGGSVRTCYGTELKELSKTADGGVQVAFAEADDAAEDEADASSVTPATWEHAQPDLLVGADGLSSVVRAACREWCAEDPSLGASPDEFTPVRLPSPSSGLNYKMLRLPAAFAVANGEANADDTDGAGAATAAPRQAYSIRPADKSPYGPTRLGILPVADPDYPRTANVILPPEHPVWSLETPEEVKAWLGGTFPQLPVDDVISEDEARSFADGVPGAFPAPCYSPRQQLLLPKSAVCLVGDAVQAFPPDIGQGVNAALANVMLLAGALDEAATTPATASEAATKTGSAAGATDEEEAPTATAAAAQPLLRRALPAYGAACAPEAEAVARIAQVGFPYQYPLTRERNPLARPLWFVNFLLRTFVLSKLLPKLFSPAAIVLVQRPHMTYSQVWKVAMQTTRRLQAVATCAVLAAAWPWVRRALQLVGV